MINNNKTVKKAKAVETISVLALSKNGIKHFCFNSKNSIVANCRVCLLELTNSPKPVASCFFFPKGMKNNLAFNTPLVLKSQKNILELILANHPIDCPFCHQGCECYLQNLSFNLSFRISRFPNKKAKRKEYNFIFP